MAAVVDVGVRRAGEGTEAGGAAAAGTGGMGMMMTTTPPTTASPRSTGHSENVKVVVRVRPLLRNEEEQRQAVQSVEVVDECTLAVHSPDPKKNVSCRFDHVLPPHATQEDLYDVVRECTMATVDGFNSTVFAYGQTGSGKTFSMFGPPELAYQSELSPLSGVIPRAISEVFYLLQNCGGEEVSVYCSFAQMYNEQLFDMLRDASRFNPLTIHEEATGEIYVQGLSEYNVHCVEDCLHLLRLAEENRAIRETHMNEFSSRSHSIFQLMVEQKRVENGAERHLRSKFNLVDLAGSEKWDLRFEMGDAHVNEMTRINLSLHTLGRCIAALASKSSQHIPFRDSKLTRLLQDSLGGNTKTCVIATLSPASDCIDESVSTLKFADSAKQVMAYVSPNETRPIDYEEVKRLRREVKHLRALLRDLTAKAGAGGGSASSAPSTASPSARQSAVLSEVDQNANADRDAGHAGKAAAPAGLDAAFSNMEQALLQERERAAQLRDENQRLHQQIEDMHQWAQDGDAQQQQQQLQLPARPQPMDEGLKVQNQALVGALEGLRKVMARFFSFEIEEDRLKSEVEAVFEVVQTQENAAPPPQERQQQQLRHQSKQQHDPQPPPQQKYVQPHPHPPLGSRDSADTPTSVEPHIGTGPQQQRPGIRAHSGPPSMGPRGTGSALASGPQAARPESSPYDRALQQHQYQQQSQPQQYQRPAQQAHQRQHQHQHQHKHSHRSDGRGRHGGGASGGSLLPPVRSAAPPPSNASSSSSYYSAGSSGSNVSRGARSNAALAGVGGSSGQGVSYRVRGRNAAAATDWISTEENEEERLRNELLEAKKRMRKHLKLQEWLREKEERELAAIREEEEAQARMQQEDKDKQRKWKVRHKKQKQKLNNYYNGLLEAESEETA